MANQPHNLGYLRMSVENAVVALLKTAIPADVDVRAAYTATEMSKPSIVVHAKNTRETETDSYNLARYVDCELRLITYAEDSALETAREAHSALLALLYDAMAQADIVDQLNALGLPRVAFWSCYAMTDAGGIANQSYVSTVEVEIGATPQEG